MAKGKAARRNKTSAHARTAKAEIGWLGGLIGFNLRIAHEASARVYLQSVAKTAPHFATLALIDLNPGISQIALARAVSRDSSSMTPLLDDLCKRKLVTRTRPVDDRRSYRLRITKAGGKILAKLKTTVTAHELALNGLFTPNEKEQLIEMLSRIGFKFGVGA